MADAAILATVGGPKANTTIATTTGGGTIMSSRRYEQTTVCLPIVYGSIAFYLGKDNMPDEYHTHQWTLYVRGPQNEDLSACIQRVIFQLHPSFAQPVREITEPPYEVTEKGWGEFEAQIRIVWKDLNEQAVIVNHFIKLYPPGDQQPMLTEPKERVVSEQYDEIVFTDPSVTFFDKIKLITKLPLLKYLEHDHFPQYSDTEVFQTLLSAQQFLIDELKTVKQRYTIAQTELQEIEDTITETRTALAEQTAAASAASGQPGAGPMDPTAAPTMAGPAIVPGGTYIPKQQHHTVGFVQSSSSSSMPPPLNTKPAPIPHGTSSAPSTMPMKAPPTTTIHTAPRLNVIHPNTGGGGKGSASIGKKKQKKVPAPGQQPPASKKAKTASKSLPSAAAAVPPANAPVSDGYPGHTHSNSSKKH